MTGEHEHDASCRPSCRPWEPRRCESCGAWECQTGSVYCGCVRCGGTGGGWPEHAGHGPSGPTGAMRGPLLCWPCFQAWEARMFPVQQGLGL